MKKFQALFAMLFVALTISLTSCSDDATSAPVTPAESPLKISPTSPNDLFPDYGENTYTYKIWEASHSAGGYWSENTTTYASVNLIIDNRASKLYSSIEDKAEGNLYYERTARLNFDFYQPELRDIYFYSDGTTLAAFQDLDRNGSPYPSGKLSLIWIYKNNSLYSKNFLNGSVYGPSYETIKVADKYLDCFVVEQFNDNNTAYEYYFAKGYGLVKFTSTNTNGGIPLVDMILESCDVK